MPILLGHSLNKIVSFSILSLFGDQLPHVCTLVGIEAGSGFWLQIADPIFVWFRNDKNRIPTANPNVFVPFAQIAYLLDSTAIANPNGTSDQPINESGVGNKTRPRRKKET
jgi:hypothetical protein